MRGFHYVGIRNVPHRKAFTVQRKRRETRACGSQRREAGIQQAIRIVLHFSALTESPHMPAACR